MVWVGRWPWRSPCSKPLPWADTPSTRAGWVKSCILKHERPPKRWMFLGGGTGMENSVRPVLRSSFWHLSFRAGNFIRAFHKWIKWQLSLVVECGCVLWAHCWGSGTSTLQALACCRAQQCASHLIPELRQLIVCVGNAWAQVNVCISLGWASLTQLLYQPCFRQCKAHPNTKGGLITAVNEVLWWSQRKDLTILFVDQWPGYSLLAFQIFW